MQTVDPRSEALARGLESIAAPWFEHGDAGRIAYTLLRDVAASVRELGATTYIDWARRRAREEIEDYMAAYDAGREDAEQAVAGMASSF